MDINEQQKRLAESVHPGQIVRCNGFDGCRIVQVCTGQLTGMAEVRVPGGIVCVGISDLNKP